MGVHDGHRERMLKRFSRSGFAGLEEHEKLEIILYFSVPRRNTNDIAHELLEKYKSISGLMDAPEKELLKNKYITERTIQLFKMIRETASLYNLQKKNISSYMTTTEEFGTYLQLYYGAIDTETFTLISLDSRGKKIALDVIDEGGLGSVIASPRQLLKTALDRKAIEVVICHNHPGGIAEPSEADIDATKTIKYLLNSIGVHLKDHIIVTRDDYLSMASSVECHHIFSDNETKGKK